MREYSLKTVTTNLSKFESPVSKEQASSKLLEELVRIKLIQVGPSGIFKQVFCLTIFFQLYVFRKIDMFFSSGLLLKSPKKMTLSYFLLKSSRPLFITCK